MTDSSQVRTIPTVTVSRVLPAGSSIAAHRHRGHQVVYASQGVLAVALDRGLHVTEPVVLEVSPLLREVLIAYSGVRGDRRNRLRAVLLDELRVSRQPALHLPVASDDRLAAVCALLADDPADPRSLAALGRAAGVSARTLTRLFAAEFGMSFPQYRTQLRLHRALRLLAEGHSVTATGHRCGWSSTSAFVDVFRRHMGHTPGGRAV